MRFFAGLIFAAIAIALPFAAALAAPCAPHDEVATMLAKNHHETRQVIAITGNGQVFEVFVSDAGTWTALVSTPAGMSCIAAAGDGFEITLPKLGEPM